MRKVIFLLILLVLFSCSVASAALVDNGDGTVTDTESGLMWQKYTAVSFRYTWQNALSYCQSLSIVGYSDWRLPNRNELQSLVDYSRYNPAIDPLLAPYTESFLYWSSTTDADDTSSAWFVSFADGQDGYGNKSASFYVRAVRAGQSGLLGHLIISKSGAGTGTVSSSPAGIACGATCSNYFTKGAAINLTATPDPGSTFTGWSGGVCSGTSTTCQVTMDGDKAVTATFTTPCAYTISPTSSLFSSSGNTGMVTVATFPSSCSWTAVSNASWITITAGSAGTGNGTVSYSVSANTTGSNRTGTMTIGGSTFTVTQNVNTEGPPPAATLISPSGAITTTTPTYTWNAVSNASYYQLWNGTAATWYTASAAGCGSGTGTCSITGSALTPGSYTWYVQTWNSSGLGPWSSGMGFTISTGGGVPSAATLISPSGAITTTTPTYTWNAVSNASYYQLWNGTAATWYTASAAGCGSGTGTCSITGSALTPGSYTWYVQTWNSSGLGPWSSGMGFTISTGGGVPSAATLISPSGAITTTTPTYTWNAVSNASYYQLWNGTAATWYTASAAGCGSGTGTCSITGSALTPGSYTWYVQTWNSSGLGPWSSGMGFTISTGGGVPSAATLISPSGAITTTTPTYTWNAVSNASY